MRILNRLGQAHPVARYKWGLESFQSWAVTNFEKPHELMYGILKMLNICCVHNVHTKGFQLIPLSARSRLVIRYIYYCKHCFEGLSILIFSSFAY